MYALHYETIYLDGNIAIQLHTCCIDLIMSADFTDKWFLPEKSLVFYTTVGIDAAGFILLSTWNQRQRGYWSYINT